MTKDEKQAALDALQAILTSRQMGGNTPTGPIPPGKSTVEVDPNLLRPEGPNLPPPPNLKIEDPDGILNKTVDQDKPEENSSSSSSSNDSLDNENDIDSENSSDENNDAGNNSDSNDSNSDGTSGNKSKNNPQSSQSNQNTDSSDDNSAEENSSTTSDSEGTTEDYATGWNEIIDRFDNDAIPDEDLEDLIARIESSDTGAI